MATKNLFYKISKDGVITHNIDKIVDINNLYFLHYDYSNSYYNRTILYIAKDVFDKHIKNNIIWPTEDQWYGKTKYIGAAIIKTKNNEDILSYCFDDNVNIIIIPVKNIINYNHYIIHNMPNRNIKCFETYDEYIKNENKKIDAKKNKNKAEYANEKKLAKTIPTFSLTSPKFKIINIIKPTNKTSAKVGDIIYGELPVIKKTSNNTGYQTLLKGIGTRTNYINIYINGVFEKSISPILFQNLFAINLQVEQV